MDVVAMLVLISVGVLGLIPQEELFSGFSNSAVITVWAVYMVSGGLFKTGVADSMGRAILRVAGNRETSLIAIIMLTVGLISAFMNNVGAVAMLFLLAQGSLINLGTVCQGSQYAALQAAANGLEYFVGRFFFEYER